MSSNLHIFIFPWLKCHWLWRSTLKNVTRDGPLIRGWPLRGQKTSNWADGGEIKTEPTSEIYMQTHTSTFTESRHLCSSGNSFYCWSCHRFEGKTDIKTNLCCKKKKSRFTRRCAVALATSVTHISSVVGMLLFVMRLIWHGSNNYLPASDWHAHKTGWVGLGSRWWHSTWPNWSISLLGRRCSTGGQHHTIYFTIYGAQTHGHQSWHPAGLHAPPPRCAKVDDITISHPLFCRKPRKKKRRKGGGGVVTEYNLW